MENNDPSSYRSRKPARYAQAAIVLGVLALVILSVYTAMAAPPGNTAFQRTWERTDRPVFDGVIPRTWMWGPEANAGILREPYNEAPGGMRDVQYFDKARMEITNPGADENSIWYVTNGLLVVELITGNMQVGDNSFEQRIPATNNVAGDADDPTGPTYATFGTLLDATPGMPDTPITARLDRDANVGNDPALAAQGVTVALIDEVTNHAIAAPFWRFMTSSGTVYEAGQFDNDQLFENPYFATGRPVTEAYWANVKVAGNYRDVLMQCFERRCLTYTPGNPEGFIVEAGNVGQHYYSWRYGQQPGEGMPTPTPTPSPTEAPVTEYAFDTQWGTAYQSIEPMDGPAGIAVANNGDLWVMDTFNDRVLRYDEHGVFLNVVGTGGGEPGQFRLPKDAAFSEDGRVYIADQNNHRVQVFSATGEYLSQWGGLGTDPGKFSYATSIAIYNGTVYVTDRDNSRIQRFDLNGGYLGQFGIKGSGDGQFDKPQQLAFDPQGNLYVVDATNARVQKFTSAGSYLSQFGSLGSGEAQFADPHGIAIDGEGNIYIGDTNNNRIQKFDPQGNYLVQWGVQGTGLGSLTLPIGLEMDRDGNVYVADFGNGRIQKFTNEGTFLYEFYDASRGTFGTLLDIAVDQNGNLLTIDAHKELYESGSITRFAPDGTPLDVLSRTRPEIGQYDILSGVAVNLENGDIYVTDRIANRVQRFTSTWQYRGTWGATGTAPGQFNGPTAITVDADGNVYVADTMNNRIQKFDANGVFLDQWGGVGDGNGQFQQPASIAVDGERIYVSDSGNDRIQVFDREGTYLGQWGTPGTESGQLDGPAGLAVNPEGSVLVVDSGNNRVQIFSPTGEALGAFGSLGSGPGQFNLPFKIAVDPDGYVYVTDILNDRVQKFAPVS